MKKLYQRLATLINARENCIKAGNAEWIAKHEQAINDLLHELPRGSGLDCDWTIDLDKSTGEKIILNNSFHHMNDVGMYDGWTDHTFTIKPSLQFGFTLSISGRNRNDIKDYLADIIDYALNKEIKEV